MVTQFLQVAAALGVVLAMVAGAAWLVRRLGVAANRGEGLAKVRGGVSVGQRERVVVVEVQDTWLVLGVAPGRVSALHTMPRPQEAPLDAATVAASPAFVRWLTRALEKRRA